MTMKSQERSLWANCYLLVVIGSCWLCSYSCWAFLTLLTSHHPELDLATLMERRPAPVGRCPVWAKSAKSPGRLKARLP